MHYWALANDPALQQVLQSGNESALAYGRRLLVARAFLSAAQQTPQLTGRRHAELTKWDKNLMGIQLKLYLRLKSLLADKSTQLTRYKSFVQNLGAIQ